MILRAKETVFFKGNRVRAGQTVEIGEGDEYPLSAFAELNPDTMQPVPSDDDEVVVAGKVGKKVKKLSDEALP